MTRHTRQTKFFLYLCLLENRYYLKENRFFCDMKKIFISILMLIPALTLQAQNVLTPQQQLEKAQKELEEAKKALEAAKIQAEAAKAKAEADKMKEETEKLKQETERIKAETEKTKAEAAKVKADAEKVKAEAEKTKTEQVNNATTSNGWVVPTATVKKADEKKVEKNAEGIVLKEDPKYLAGAVTTNAEGKVEFSLDTDANGKSAAQIYDIVFQYMSELTQGEQNINSRVALVNKDEHVIANVMDEWMVFNQSFISLDRTEAKYQLVANIQDNHLHLTMGRIYYTYEEGRSTGFKEPAENVITDKYALNKKKNDLAKIYGKFRRLTIDRKDQIFSELSTLIKQ